MKIIDKKIDKMIDKYYERKFMYKLKDIFIMYNLDFKIEDSKNFIQFYVKKKHFKDECFNYIKTISKKDILCHIVNFYEFYKEFDKLIDKYIKECRDDYND